MNKFSVKNASVNSALKKSNKIIKNDIQERVSANKSLKDVNAAYKIKNDVVRLNKSKTKEVAHKRENTSWKDDRASEVAKLAILTGTAATLLPAVTDNINAETSLIKKANK